VFEVNAPPKPMLELKEDTLKQGCLSCAEVTTEIKMKAKRIAIVFFILWEFRLVWKRTGKSGILLQIGKYFLE